MRTARPAPQFFISAIVADSVTIQAVGTVNTAFAKTVNILALFRMRFFRICFPRIAVGIGDGNRGVTVIPAFVAVFVFFPPRSFAGLVIVSIHTRDQIGSDIAFIVRTRSHTVGVGFRMVENSKGDLLILRYERIIGNDFLYKISFRVVGVDHDGFLQGCLTIGTIVFSCNGNGANTRTGIGHVTALIGKLLCGDTVFLTQNRCHTDHRVISKVKYVVLNGITVFVFLRPELAGK